MGAASDQIHRNSTDIMNIIETLPAPKRRLFAKYLPLAEREVCLAVNGPLLQHADPLLKKAIKEMFKDAKDANNREGHFVRRNNNIADYSVSKSVDSFVKERNQKPFIC